MRRIGSFLIAGALALSWVPGTRPQLPPGAPTGVIAGVVRSERPMALAGVPPSGCW